MSLRRLQLGGKCFERNGIIVFIGNLFSAFTITPNKRDALRHREKFTVFRQKSKGINKVQKSVALSGWKTQLILLFKI